MCLFAEDINRLCREVGSADTVRVDVLFETLVAYVHLAKTCENLVDAGVVVFSNVRLKLGNI